MRRTATLPRYFLAPILVLITASVLTVVPAAAKTRAEHRVIIKVNHVSRISQLEDKYGFKAKKSVSRGASAILVVEDIPLGILKNALKDEVGIDFIVNDDVMPLDGGETVLPLDRGETVLPLDGETDQKITALLDGGETVLPLDELKVIAAPLLPWPR